MAFEGLSDRLDNAFKKLKSKGSLTESDAQESMLELLLHSDGYGDDFSFVKSGNLCVIRSEHAQGKPLFPTAGAYYSYDIAAAEKNFILQNESFFQSIYFDFARRETKAS